MGSTPLPLRHLQMAPVTVERDTTSSDHRAFSRSPLVPSGQGRLCFSSASGSARPIRRWRQAISFQALSPSATLPRVTIGGVPATVSFAGLVAAGLFQFNVIVPNAGSGDQLLQATVGGVTTPANVFITLQ